MAVADVTSERPYKKAWPVAEAVDEIKRCSGGHLDPQIVDAFLLKVPEMTEVQQQFVDMV